jgi:hypothetical protein
MARRNPRNTATADETANETPEQTGNEEATVTATAAEPEVTEAEATDEAPAEVTEATGEAQASEGDAPAEADATTEPEADPVADLMKLCAEIMEDEGRDKQTGSLPEALIAKFGEAYRKLDASEKRKARPMLTGKVQELLDDEGEDTMYDSIMRAKSYNLLVNETKKAATATRATATAAKVDPTEAYVDQFLSLSLATMALPIADEVDKEKAGESIHALVNAYQDPETNEHKSFEAYAEWYRNTDTENRGDEPEVPEYVKRAFKAADGKAAGARRRASAGGGSRPRVPGGAQGDIGKHVAEAMADVPVGEFKAIAWISKFPSKEYEGKNPPSAGAVSARLFPSSGGPSTIPNIEGVTAEDSPEGKKGARRTA